MFQYRWDMLAQLLQHMNVGCFEDWELNVHDRAANEEAALELIPNGNGETQVCIQMFRPNKRFSVDPNDKENYRYSSRWAFKFIRPRREDDDSDIQCAYLSCNNTEIPLNHESEAGGAAGKYKVQPFSRTMLEEPCGIREPHKVIVYLEPGSKVTVRPVPALYKAVKINVDHLRAMLRSVMPGLDPYTEMTILADQAMLRGIIGDDVLATLGM